MRVRIVGHTDSTGSDAINNPLSVDRAQSVRDYLVGRGVARSARRDRGPRRARAGGRQRQRCRPGAEPARRDLPARAGAPPRLTPRSAGRGSALAIRAIAGARPTPSTARFASQYEDFMRHVHTHGVREVRPHRHRHEERLRPPDALRPARGLPAGHDEEGAPEVHHPRAAVVPARRRQRALAAGTRRDDLGRMGQARRRPRPGLRRAVAQLADARRRPHRPDRRGGEAAARPTPTRAASSSAPGTWPSCRRWR